MNQRYTCIPLKFGTEYRQAEALNRIHIHNVECSSHPLKQWDTERNSKTDILSKQLVPQSNRHSCSSATAGHGTAAPLQQRRHGRQWRSSATAAAPSMP